MAIAKSVVTCLQSRGIQYSVIPHPRCMTARESAESAHVPAGHLAKAVVLADRKGYVMAVVPGNRHVEVYTLSRRLGRELSLAAESRLAPVFDDCEPGAIPPLGPLYGMETVMDDSLVGLPEIFFEAGDHEELIRVKGEEFVRLMREARHSSFSH